jgi:phosphoenolpyruvate-protein kinase (PTS system EI component)
MTQVYSGLAAAPGIGIGALHLYRPGLAAPFAPTSDRVAIDPNQEWQTFLEARSRVDAELEELATNPNSLIGEIFAAHQAILQDKTLLDWVQAGIYEDRLSAAAATHKTINELADLFRSFEDDYFAGRAIDILDLGQRLLEQLGTALSRTQLAHLPPQTILVAEDLTLSDLAQLPATHVVGIALAYSTPTAHSAILARSLGIPMVCAIGPTILQLLPEQSAVVDGNAGHFLVDLEPAELARYLSVRQEYLAAGELALSHAHGPAYTLDGVHIPVLANANSPQEVAQCRAVGADGIGLLRTEYLFQDRASPPGFDEQQSNYSQFISQVDNQITVRALDAGGDKPVNYISHHREENPFLGLRGVRLLIAEPELLRVQYRALQAAAHNMSEPIEVRFMLPMISTAEEIFTVRAILNAIVDESNDVEVKLWGDSPKDSDDGSIQSRNKGNELPHLKLGIMIEVPSAALIASTLAPHVDFFSIGTNDLAQYVFASDRTNSVVAKMADPLHPAVLQLIHQTCVAAQAAGKPVSLCGEIAGDPLAVPLLLGLGVNELSMALPAIPLIKEVVRSVEMAHCRQLAMAALACGSATAVRALLVADRQPF